MTAPLLVPCPFCGSDGPSIHQPFDDLDGFYGYCQKCLTMGPRCTTLQAAIAAWNRRAPVAVNAELLAALKALVEAIDLHEIVEMGAMRVAIVLPAALSAIAPAKQEARFSMPMYMYDRCIDTLESALTPMVPYLPGKPVIMAEEALAFSQDKIRQVLEMLR